MTDTDTLIIDLDGELIPIDESTLDFSDFSPAESELIARMFGGALLDDDGNPPPAVIATFITIKLVRTRSWSKDQLDAVLELLVAWLTNQLEEVPA